MRIKNRKLVLLKKKLKAAGITGLALDIDETLSFTIGFMVEELIKKLGNPENLTAKEIARKYRHTDKIPYWQKEDATKVINEIITSNEIQKDLPLIENANETVQKINKIIPIVAYITVRSNTVFEGTKFWLKKHNFPKAEIITKPKNIPRKKGNQWKAKVLEYLYPQVVGIVDDNPGLTTFFGKKYKGVVYLYDNTETERKDINVVPCEDWETVTRKIEQCRL
jgi:hypothetical protein